jgi:hypothetical protein
VVVFSDLGYSLSIHFLLDRNSLSQLTNLKFMLVFSLTPAEACQSRALLSPMIWFELSLGSGYDLGRYLLLLGVFFSYLYIAHLNLQDPATAAYCKVPTIATIILLYHRITKAIISESNLSQASVCGHLWVRSGIFWWDHQIYVQVGSSSGGSVVLVMPPFVVSRTSFVEFSLLLYWWHSSFTCFYYYLYYFAMGGPVLLLF